MSFLPRSYAVAAKSLGLDATVLLPSTAPQSREELLKDMGVGGIFQMSDKGIL